MDEKQPWWGNYWSLDVVAQFLKQLPKELSKKDKANELLITWAISKFLTWRNKTEHLVGFPTYEEHKNTKLSEFVAKNIAIDDENFDTIILATRKMHVQVKRFISEGSISTEDFFNYMIDKLRRYGKDDSLNVVFHIQSAFKLDLRQLKELCADANFSVGSVILFLQMEPDRTPGIFEIHPTFSEAIWALPQR